MNNKKSKFYWIIATATALTLIGQWTHMATSISVYEIKDSSDGLFSWSFAGVIISTSTTLFLIFTAILKTKMEKVLRNIPAKAQNKFRIEFYTNGLKTFNMALWFFAFFEMYGNIYYSLAAHVGKPKFTLSDLAEKADTISILSIVIFSLLLPVVSIVGSKQLSVAEIDEEEEIRLANEKPAKIDKPVPTSGNIITDESTEKQSEPG